jgi:hypothetical protein
MGYTTSLGDYKQVREDEGFNIEKDKKQCKI